MYMSHNCGPNLRKLFLPHGVDGVDKRMEGTKLRREQSSQHWCLVRANKSRTQAIEMDLGPCRRLYTIYIYIYIYIHIYIYIYIFCRQRKHAHSHAPNTRRIRAEYAPNTRQIRAKEALRVELHAHGRAGAHSRSASALHLVTNDRDHFVQCPVGIYVVSG